MQDAPQPVQIEQSAATVEAGYAETVTEDGRVIIDLMPRRSTPTPCEDSTDGTIVVCGEADDPELYRYDPALETPPVDGMDKAEVELAEGVSATAETEQVAVGGFPSNRVMARVKIRF